MFHRAPQARPQSLVAKHPRHDGLNVPISCTRVAAYRSKGNLNLACQRLPQLFFGQVLQICTLPSANGRSVKLMFSNMFPKAEFAVRNTLKIFLTRLGGDVEVIGAIFGSPAMLRIEAT